MTDGREQIVRQTIDEHKALVAQFERAGAAIIGRIAE